MVFFRLLQQQRVPPGDRDAVGLDKGFQLGAAFRRGAPCKAAAGGDFPGNIRIARQYGKLVKLDGEEVLPQIVLNNPGITHIPQWGLQITCTAPEETGEGWKVQTKGALMLRSRGEGDTIVLSGGRKSLKKLFIDRKIPASQRSRVPVITDERGVVGVVGIGPNRERLENANVCITIEISAKADE